MRRVVGIGLPLAILFLCGVRLSAQKDASAESGRALVLAETIVLENVKGRFDGADAGGGRLYVAARGNNTLEVVDVGARTQARSIHIPDPTGVAYSPETKKIFVGSGRMGKVYIVDGNSYEITAVVDFGSDVDGLRYEKASKRVYVSFGDGETAGIGTIDATTSRRLEDEYKLGSHAEGFEMETSGPNIYANLPDDQQIAVINRKTRAITKWPSPLAMNFPMALDEAGHRLFIASTGRPRFVALDTDSGRVVANLPCVEGTDDMFFDGRHKRIYIPGSEGYVSVFQQLDPDHYKALANVPSEIGSRGGVYPPVAGKGFDRFYVAVPAAANRSAEILMYTVED